MLGFFSGHVVAYYLTLVSLAALASLLLFFVFLFFVSNLKASKEHALVPAGLPWMGVDPSEYFSAIRANFRGLVDSVALYTAGYRKVRCQWPRGSQHG